MSKHPFPHTGVLVICSLARVGGAFAWWQWVGRGVLLGSGQCLPRHMDACSGSRQGGNGQWLLGITAFSYFWSDNEVIHTMKENVETKDTVVVCSTAESSDFTPDQTSFCFHRWKAWKRSGYSLSARREERVEILPLKKQGLSWVYQG